MRNPYANGAAPLSMLADPFREREPDDLINRKMPDTLLGNRKVDGLLNAVGPNRGNHPSDVARVERRLGGVGYLDPARASRPTGRFDDGLVRDLRAYQQANGLKVDALLNPGGPTERSLDAGIGRLRRNAAPRRVELDAERGTENQRLADAITKAGDLGPLPVYVGEAAMGREKGCDEIVDLFRRVAAHGEDVAERLHTSLKGYVDPDLHRTLYAESQIPEPDGGEGGDDAEEHPGTPETPPTKPDDPKKPDDPDQPEKPDEGDKEDPKVPKPDPCLYLRLDAKESQENLIRLDNKIREIEQYKANWEEKARRLRSGETEPDMDRYGDNGSRTICLPDIPIPRGRRLTWRDLTMSLMQSHLDCHQSRVHASRDAGRQRQIEEYERQIRQFDEELAALKKERDLAEKEHERMLVALEDCKAHREQD